MMLEKLLKKEIDKLPDKYALFLSGGVDSGVLAALSKPEKIFSVYLPFGKRFNEFNDVLKTVNHLGIKHKLVKVEADWNKEKIERILKKSVKAIGRPIPHYNIIPFYVACREAKKRGFTDIVVGDGPDETMCGYTRHLIMRYLYGSYNIEAFDKYHPLLDKVLISPDKQYAKMIGKDTEEVERFMVGRSLLDGMCMTDMYLMRPDMDDMSDKIAESFGIKIHRPYQDNKEFDQYQFDLDEDNKVCGEYGKCLLRTLASRYLPEEIAWRKQKVGGPLVPVNKLMGWKVPEFDKSKYLEYQSKILENE